MCRANRRWRTIKVQQRRYRLITQIEGNESHIGFCKWELIEPLWWFDERDKGQLKNDLPVHAIKSFKVNDRDIWLRGKRVKAVRSNIYFAEELEELGFTHNLRLSVDGDAGLWD